MLLLTKENKKQLPALMAQDGKGEDAICYVKFFCPWNQWTWYATEYDPQDRIFFGKVHGLETELGYFTLDELESVIGMGGLKIERDMHFTPKPLKECN